MQLNSRNPLKAVVIAVLSMIAVAALTERADAVTVTVGGEDFNIESFTGTFLGNEALFESQPWYGDEALALDFATEYVIATGQPTSFGFVTEAACDVSAPGAGCTRFRLKSFGASTFGTLVFTTGATVLDNPGPWAAVSSIPLPAGLPLMVASLLVLAVLRRRQSRVS